MIPAASHFVRSVAPWLAIGPATLALHLLGPMASEAAVGLAVATIALALLRSDRRVAATHATAVLLLSALAALGLHLLRDDFALNYVWLYSATALPWYLKLANLWAGDEGTLLLLAALSAVLALPLVRRAGWAGPWALAVCAAFALAALAWSPFRATPAEALALAESRGMNAHLTRVWMVFHPPQIFLALLLTVMPLGAALEALAGRRGDWATIAPARARWAWFVLTAGIVVGMWWAYEDFTYGTLWHWDPVQTSVFVMWCLLSAQLHTLTRYRPDGPFAVAHPLLACLAAIAAVLVMVVTRAPQLASSHRYLGETSLPFLLGLAASLLAATLAALAVRWRGGWPSRVPAPGTLRLRVALWLFVACGLIAAGHLANAYASAALGLPRPDNLKPFFETLTRFADAGELAELRAVFARWDVDGFALNRWLAPAVAGLALLAGHFFLPLAGPARLAVSTAVAAAALWAALELRFFAGAFRGTGLTSSQTVQIFAWLDALAVTGAYMALAVTAAWLAAIGRGGDRRRVLRHDLPVGVIHLGVVVALGAGLAATVFDSYAQRLVSYPADFGRTIAFPDGYSLSVELLEQGWRPDGGRAEDAKGAFYSLASVGWSLHENGTQREGDRGHTVYRDRRALGADGPGPVRLMCEIIDYRYARHVSEAGQMIHPLISRGLWRDVQIWFPALRGPAEGVKAPLVLKVFPLLSWVWVGFALVLIGHGAILLRAEQRRKVA